MVFECVVVVEHSVEQAGPDVGSGHVRVRSNDIEPVVSNQLCPGEGLVHNVEGEARGRKGEARSVTSPEGHVAQVE